TGTPGGNLFNVNGVGELIHNQGPNAVSVTGNVFEVNGTPIPIPATVVVPTVNVAGGVFTYDGLPHPATASVTGVIGATVTFNYIDVSGNIAATPVNAGT